MSDPPAPAPTVLFDGAVLVDYGQFYIVDGEGWDHNLEACMAGHRNGLCGAAEPGGLFLLTGTRAGRVPVRAELHDGPPPLDPGWEDVVEVSWRVRGAPSIMECGGAGRHRLDLPGGDHRVRYAASGLDQEAGDRYLLQFWAEPPAPDAVLVETSQAAGHRHRWARALPPQPSAAERAARHAEAQRRFHEERVAAMDEESRRRQLRAWGGTMPSERLQRVMRRFGPVPEAFWPALRAADAAGDEACRGLARFCVRDAFTVAGLSVLPWAGPVLAAPDHGRALPAPFEDLQAAVLHGGDHDGLAVRLNEQVSA